MPEMTITIGDSEAKIIEKLAADTRRTPRELVEQRVNSWAQGQFDAYYVEKVNKMSKEDKIKVLGDVS